MMQRGGATKRNRFFLNPTKSSLHHLQAAEENKERHELEHVNAIPQAVRIQQEKVDQLLQIETNGKVRETIEKC